MTALAWDFASNWFLRLTIALLSMVTSTCILQQSLEILAYQVPAAAETMRQHFERDGSAPADRLCCEDPLTNR